MFSAFLFATLIVQVVQGSVECSTPQFVGGRLFWDHDASENVFIAWIQSTWMPGTNTQASPDHLEMICNGQFTSSGSTNEDPRLVNFSSFYDIRVGYIQSDLQTDTVDTPLGTLDRTWGQSMLADVEVGSHFECCITGESRYSPLQNAENCAEYSLCIDVDLREESTGPKPAGEVQEVGLVDKLFEQGFVIEYMCTGETVDLETLRQDYYSDISVHLNENSATDLSSIATINEISPEITNEAIFSWDTDQFQNPQGTYAINTIFQQSNERVTTSRDESQMRMSGSMNVDFALVFDDSVPSCEILLDDEFLALGEMVTGRINVVDMSEGVHWHSTTDKLDVSRSTGSVDFFSNVSLPMFDASPPFGFDISTVCTEPGTFNVGVDVVDSCGHEASCSVSYECTERIYYLTQYNLQDVRTSGYVSGRGLTFTKSSSSTLLEITYTDNFYVPSGYYCDWRIYIDNKHCSSENHYYRIYGKSTYDTASINAICSGFEEGRHTLTIYVAGNGQNCYTGYYTTFLLSVEEVIDYIPPIEINGASEEPKEQDFEAITAQLEEQRSDLDQLQEKVDLILELLNTDLDDPSQ